MPFMDFDAALAAEEREPVEFTLKGETFRGVSVDDLPWTAGMRLAAAPDDGPEAEAAIGRWFDAVVAEEDRGRFQEVLENLGGRRLTSLVEWLAEVYSGRPTSQPSVSASGSKATGPSPRVVRLWQPADQPQASTG